MSASASERQPWLRNCATAAAMRSSSVVTAPPSPVVTILRGMEAEAAQQAERAARAAAAARAERARGVLDQRQVGKLLDPARAAEEVHGDDRLRARADLDLARDRCSSSPGRRRRAPAAGRRARRRSRSPGTCRRERAPRRPGSSPSASTARWSAAVPDETATRVLGLAGARELLLELGDARAHREHPALEHGRDRLELLGARRRAARAGSRASFSPGTTRSSASRPSSSSTCGSQPSSSRAFSTFGIRSSTST